MFEFVFMRILFMRFLSYAVFKNYGTSFYRIKIFHANAHKKSKINISASYRAMVEYNSDMFINIYAD